MLSLVTDAKVIAALEQEIKLVNAEIFGENAKICTKPHIGPSLIDKYT